MGNPLQERRAPQELAARGQVIEISNNISDFKRLAEIVESDLNALDPEILPSDWRDAIVAGRLGFGFTAAQQAVPALDGQVAVTIAAVCQRCLQPFKLPLQVELRVVFDDESSTAAGDEGYEVWELDNDKVCPVDLVEEALIMALPYVAMHDPGAECAGEIFASDDRPGKKEDRMTTPFASLKAQMDQEN
jgi:uncharacterized protein